MSRIQWQDVPVSVERHDHATIEDLERELEIAREEGDEFEMDRIAAQIDELMRA